jgi:hypothetical protein
MLRLAARRCLLIQAIHSCCLHEFNQLSGYAATPHDLGWRIVPQLGPDTPKNAPLQPEQQKRCDAVKAVFESPHPLYEKTFSGFLQRVLKDHLTINRVVIELIRDQQGKVVQFRSIDGATILPTMAVLERFIRQRSPEGGTPMAYETAALMLERETGQPIRDAEYVCVMRGQLVGTFPHGQLLVWEFDQSTDVREIFPPSYCEKALEGIVSWLYAFYYNKNYFMVGNPIEVILGVSGEMEDDSFIALQEQLRENFSGLKGAWRVPLVQLPTQGGLSVIKLKENHRDMQFMEWHNVLVSLICAIYRKHPNRIYFEGGSQERAALFGHNRDEEIETSEEEGFRNNRLFFGQHLNRLVQLIDPDLTFTWSGLELDDRQAEIQIETAELATYVTIDELRERKGQKPFRQPWSQVPLNPLVFQAAGLTGGGEMGGAGGGPANEDEEEATQQATGTEGRGRLAVLRGGQADKSATAYEEIVF